MSIRIKDATPIDELQDHLLFAVGNTEGDTDGCVSLGQVKDFTDADKATVAFTGSYLNLTDAPNLEAYVQMTTLQQNYYTRNQINQIIGGITGPKYVKVEELPERGENNVIYLLPQEGGGQQNIFDEYVWLPDGLIYERIGSTQADFDNYYDKEEVDALIPSVSNATITLQQGGVTKGTFTLNQSSNKTINLDESFVQEQADWDVEDPTAVDYIKNKPTIPTVNDPTITFTQGGVTKGTVTLNQSQAEIIEFDSQVQADWEQEDNTEPDYIKNKPETLSLEFTYDDNSIEIIDFYIKNIEVTYNYFYVKNEYQGTNTLTIIKKYYQQSPTGKYVQYSKDRINWTTLNLSVSGTYDITLNEGEKVYFRNDNGEWNRLENVSQYSTNSFTCSENFSVGGNLMSLVKYTDMNITPPDYCLSRLFAGISDAVGHENTTLIDISDLVFPTTMSKNCCEQMFDHCVSLTTVPSNLLPATTLANDCYAQMFSYCSSLTNVPNLPATTLAQGCYFMMFAMCSSLTTIPSDLLPSTTLAEGCYLSMFTGCSSLTNVANLPATTLAKQCYGSMYNSCSSLTTVPSNLLPATTLEEGCYRFMFGGCGITTAPTLPATTLVKECYNYIFGGCRSLNSVTTYADDISAQDCLKNWLNNVSSTGTFHNLGSATYTTGVSGIPSGWTEVNS